MTILSSLSGSSITGIFSSITNCGCTTGTLTPGGGPLGSFSGYFFSVDMLGVGGGVILTSLLRVEGAGLDDDAAGVSSRC